MIKDVTSWEGGYNMRHWDYDNFVSLTHYRGYLLRNSTAKDNHHYAANATYSRVILRSITQQRRSALLHPIIAVRLSLTFISAFSVSLDHKDLVSFVAHDVQFLIEGFRWQNVI